MTTFYVCACTASEPGALPPIPWTCPRCARVWALAELLPMILDGAERPALVGIPLRDQIYAVDTRELILELIPERCVGCGCTEFEPCAGGCGWVGPSMCSSCFEVVVHGFSSTTGEVTSIERRGLSGYVTRSAG